MMDGDSELDFTFTTTPLLCGCKQQSSFSFLFFCLQDHLWQTEWGGIIMACFRGRPARGGRRLRAHRRI